MCPLSNVACKGVARIEEHPLPRMLELGLVATVNSDDPAYFGGGIDANVAAVRTSLGMTDDDLATLAAQLLRGRLHRRRPTARAGWPRWTPGGR